MNISKADKLIVKDREGKILCNIEIGAISLAKMHDKTQILTIQQIKN